MLTEADGEVRDDGTHCRHRSDETRQIPSRVKCFTFHINLSAMWTLECHSSILDSKSEQQQCCEIASSHAPLDKRIWLRPGKKYLFGRTLDLSRGSSSMATPLRSDRISL